MKTWTEQAEKRLGEWLCERVEREGLSGDEAAELSEDLRRHVHEELEESEYDPVSLVVLETVLGRLSPAGDPAVQVGKKAEGGWSKVGHVAAWTCGVVLPAGVMLFEWFASFCGVVFFDPLPDFWHLALAATVPLVNAWLLRGMGQAGRGPWWVRAVAAGFVWVVALAYALLFVPLLPASVLAVIVWGLGLLSLTPILAWVATWRIGRRAERGWPEVEWRRAWWSGVAAALALLAVLEGPALWTRTQLVLAGDDEPAMETAVKRLRGFHSERTLLRACYEGNRGTAMSTDIAGWVFRGWSFPALMFGGRLEEVDSERMRDLFFRVTGKPFNQAKPPRTVRKGSLFSRNGQNFENIDWDDHLGGDEVAVRLKHLDLAESRFDGHLDGVSRLGYGEWTMVFRNGAPTAREARCRVRLPHGGRVSRLTLWIEGEPREAAFNAVAKVKAAYKSVAVVQRKDPVLVTMAGPDTVMVQCFPVPAHGEMKIRLGVTAPLKRGAWELPRIIERNFGVVEGLEQAVWFQADRSFRMVATGLDSVQDGDGHSLASTVPPLAGSPGQGGVELSGCDGEPAVVWCSDRFASEEERVLLRTPVRERPAPCRRCVVVVDASASLAGWEWAIADGLESVNDGDAEVIVLLADDDVRRVTVAQLRRMRFRGGCNNEPALREAVRLAKDVEGGAVVWVHGPQPVDLGQAETIRQLLERGSRRPLIHDVSMAPGPNRLAEQLWRSGRLVAAPSMPDPAADLGEFIEGLCRPGEDWSWHWSRPGADAAPEGAEQVWDQLARSWAMGQVGDTEAGPEEQNRLAMLAARYQLVTPVSGAVVLETAAQYAAHGLKPVDADATPQLPSVPEPSTWVLVMLGLGAAIVRRRREGQS